MITDALKILIKGQNLDYEMVKAVMKEITEGKAEETQIASFLTGLRIKGESVEEITAAAEIMKEKCIKINLGTTKTLDIVGTGGDMSNTFNISTTTAFVAAAGGIPIAKHGNRALSSKSGAADVLEALGAKLNISPQKEIELFKKLNICFMYAPNHHPAMKYAAKVRKDLKFRTLFNILGPLTNPANATSQLFGVFDGALTETLCKVISKLGVENVLVVHGKDGIDEVSISEKTMISEYKNNMYKNYEISPETFGLKLCSKKDIEGGNAQDNAKIILNIFENKDKGPKKNVILLNSALAFYTYGTVKNIQDGIALADDIITSGKSLKKLEEYVKASNEV